jgi:hypothetical protein
MGSLRSTTSLNDHLERTINVPALAGFTVMAWIKMLAAPSSASMLFAIGANTGGASSVAIYLNTTPTLRTWIGTAGVNGTRTFPTNIWTHIAFSCIGVTDGNAWNAYFNGLSDLSTAASSSSAVTGNLGICSSIGNNYVDKLDGRMASAKVFTRVLTQQQIQDEMQYWKVINAADAINCWFPMRDGDYLKDFALRRDLVLTNVDNSFVIDSDEPPIIWEPKKAINFRVHKSLSAGASQAPFFADVQLPRPRARRYISIS